MEDNTWKEKNCGNCRFWEKPTGNRPEGKCLKLSGTGALTNKEVFPEIEKTGIESYPIREHDGAGFTYETLAWFSCGHFTPLHSNPNYNSAPEGLKEITLEEWRNGMFTYCIKPVESRQVRGEQTCDLRMFDVPNFENKILGYAIKWDWFDNQTGKNRPEPRIVFCRYGLDEDWVKFERKFAAQFAGDNS